MVGRQRQSTACLSLPSFRCLDGGQDPPGVEEGPGDSWERLAFQGSCLLLPRLPFLLQSLFVGSLGPGGGLWGGWLLCWAQKRFAAASGAELVVFGAGPLFQRGN